MAKKATGSEEPKFSKKALYESQKYKEMKDLIEALLEDDKEYSRDEVDAIIANFLNKEVN